jgi:alkylation response protein AidB-like acyl-CoA dehydrogenase
MAVVAQEIPINPRLTEPTTAQLFAQAEQLSAYFYETAAERDKQGGTPLAQRQAIRDSGLLKLSIAKEFGGYGLAWPDIYKIIRIIARSDSSLAHVFAFQFLMLASIRLYGSGEQWQSLFKETAAQNLWWGNALNPLDTRTLASEAGEHLLS